MTNQDQAAQVIYDEVNQTWERGEILTAAGEAERIANALADAGLLAPDLPEPSFIMDEDGEKRICWNTPDCDVELEPGEMIVTSEAQAGHEIEHAHAYALALLAASTYKEEA